MTNIPLEILRYRDFLVQSKLQSLSNLFLLHYKKVASKINMTKFLNEFNQWQKHEMTEEIGFIIFELQRIKRFISQKKNDHLH